METVPYDKRSGKIWFNGELINWTDAKVHVLNHGLHYASCVFEGERVYDGEIFKRFNSLRTLFKLCFVTFSFNNNSFTLILSFLSIKYKVLW